MSNRRQHGRTFSYPRPDQQPIIGARTATRRDMDGNIISGNTDAAFKDIHRGMDGEPISGKDRTTGQYVNFPKPKTDFPGQPAAPSPGQLAGVSPGAVHDDLNSRGPAPGGGAPTGFPQSAMTTGNADVAFKGSAERLAAMDAKGPGPADPVGAAVVGAPPAGGTIPMATYSGEMGKTTKIATGLPVGQYANSESIPGGFPQPPPGQLAGVSPGAVHNDLNSRGPVPGYPQPPNPVAGAPGQPPVPAPVPLKKPLPPRSEVAATGGGGGGGDDSDSD